MTIEFIIAFARSISYFHIKNLNNVTVLIGRDTRISGNIIENLISGILNYNGIDYLIMKDADILAVIG